MARKISGVFLIGAASSSLGGMSIAAASGSNRKVPPAPPYHNETSCFIVIRTFRQPFRDLTNPARWCEVGGSLGSHISREKGYLLKNRGITKELHKKVNYLSENSRIQEVSQEELHFFFRNTPLSVEKLPIRQPE